LTYVKAPAKPRRSFLMGHSPFPWPRISPCPGRGRAFRQFEVVKTGPNAGLRAMFKPFEFCIPTKSTSVPVGPKP
jgi:hypothetical protein